MPQIPTFVSTQSYQGAGGGQPSTISPGLAVQDNNPLAVVTAHFAKLAENMEKQQGALEAAKIGSEADMKLADLQQQFATDPEPTTAAKRFQEAMAKLQNDTLSTVTNPIARDLLTKHMATKAPLAYAHVMTGAIKNQNQMTIAATEQAVSRLGIDLANAPDDASAAIALQGINEKYAYLESVHAVTPLQAYMGKSKAIADGILNIQDPVKAKAMLDRVGNGIDISHRNVILDHLKGPLLSIWAGGEADRVLSGGQSGGRAATIPQGFDALWSRVEGAESGGRQFASNGTVLTSSAGAEGVSQIKGPAAKEAAASLGVEYDAERVKNDEGYNRQLGQEYLRIQLRKYGNESLALAAYNAGPKQTDDWLKDLGDPRDGKITMQEWVSKIPFKETRNYVTKIAIVEPSGSTQPESGGEAATASQSSGPRSRTDWARLDRDIKNGPYTREQAAALTKELHRRRVEDDALLADERLAMGKTLEGLNAALAHGKDAPIPEDKIRALFPADVANGLLKELDISRAAGTYGEIIKYGDQAAVNDALRAAAPNENEPLGLQTFPHQQKVYERLLAMKHARDVEMAKDSAAYAARSPRMAKWAEAIQSQDPQVNTPEARANYIQALMDEQGRMGVPVGDRKPLPKTEVDRIVHGLTRLDLTKQNIGDELAKLEQVYGPAWEKVFPQLMQDGKLPVGFQFIANADSVAAKDAMQKVMAADGSWSKNSPAKPQDVKVAVHNALGDFRRVTMARGAVGAYNHAAEFATELTHYYIMTQGKSVASAAQQAAGDMFGKYGFSGATMYPKELGHMPAIATRGIQNSLTAEVLTVPGPSAATAGMTDAARATQWVDTVKSQGEWVMNKTGTGMVLRVPTTRGLEPVKFATGEPVELLFDGIPQSAARAGSHDFEMGRAPGGWRREQFPSAPPPMDGGRAPGMGWRQ